VARARNDLGEALRARSDWPAARAEHARALDLLQSHGGDRSPLLARPLVGLAECEARMGRPGAAREALQRALAVADPGEIALAKEARHALDALPRP
jgi:hypothetical protein